MKTKATRHFAIRRSRGMQICHFDGFFQKSVLTGDQLTNDGSFSVVALSLASVKMLVSSPISERLPIVKRRVMVMSRRGNEWQGRVSNANERARR